MTSDKREDSTLTIGVVSEIHCTPPGEPNVSWHNELRFDLGLSLLEASLASFARHDVDVIAVLGDLTNFADLESMQRVRRMLRATGKPVIVLSGNHDITADDHAASGFQRFFVDDATCAPPLVASFHGYDVQLLGLERSAETNALSSLGPPLASHNAGLNIVMSHYPLLPLAETLGLAGLKHAGDITDLDQRANELDSLTEPALVLHGHLHVRATTVRGRVLQLSFAALVEPPHECSVLTVRTTVGGDLRVERSATSVHAANVTSLPLLSPSDEIWSFDGGSWSEREDHA
ncbi:MAG: metallophosphoesterase family protein [Thermomicrobiales bacterium]|nr:metallophosphoesterase family protein [Thermomicrobiales bacterium]